MLIIFINFPLYSISFSDDEDPVRLASRITEQMTDEQALAQTFMLGWVGAEPSPVILDWIRERQIGGVKIFGWNTDDTRRLARTVGELQSHALDGPFGIPLLIATDQEGGIVRHVKGDTSETPGNMAIGASGRPIDAYWSGYYIGKEIALLGINMNFAPTVDLYTNPDSVLISTRSFGSDPVQAAILGSAFAKGQLDAGLIPTAKHFPGHGDTALDSHGVLPRINLSFEELMERELIPYKMMINEGIPAIMSAHLAFPNTEAGPVPASLSPWFLTEVLRKEMGFEGLIITDDLLMNGALIHARSLPQAAKMALLAGNDVIMISSTPALNDLVWTSLLDSMRNEPEFRDRVRDACRRILTMKLIHLRGEGSVPYIPDLDLVDAGIADPRGTEFFLGLAARSVTLINNSDALPLNSETAGRVLLAGNFSDFFTVGRRAFPTAITYWYSPLRPLTTLLNHARNVDTVIFCLFDRAGMRILNQLQMQLYHTDIKIIVLSVSSPALLDDLYRVDASLSVYSYAHESFIAGFSAMLGRIPASGRVPFPYSPERPPRQAVLGN
ncbi:MAG: glycoside hydrolase family 3 protein [Treponema sp.]|nr:glycoside hydrolase family 3 protein [Treponema sp.]